MLFKSISNISWNFTRNILSSILNVAEPGGDFRLNY